MKKPCLQMLIFDMSDVDWAPNSKLNDLLSLASRVLKVNQSDDGSDEGNWSVSGVYPPTCIIYWHVFSSPTDLPLVWWTQEKG